MCDMLMDSICRLCLKDNFSLVSMYSSRTPAGEPVFRVLNKIYDLKISKEDRLPSKICVPCLWRMFEFDTYKKNVKYADSELGKLLSRTTSNSDEVSSEDANDNDVLGEGEIPMNEASDVCDTRDNVNKTEVSMKQEIHIEEWTMAEKLQPEKVILEMSIGKDNVQNNAECDVIEEEMEVPVKDEIDIVEWEMPNELQSKADIEEELCSERHLSIEEGINSIDNSVEASEVIPVKDEIDIVEWEMPNELQSKANIEEGHCFERHLSLEEDINSIGNAVESSEVMSSRMDLEAKECVNRNEKVEQFKFSDLNEANTSVCVKDRDESPENVLNGSSVVSNSENKDANEVVMQEDVSKDGNEGKESFDALLIEGSYNLAESSTSRSVRPIESKKKDFVCNVCQKSFVKKDFVCDVCQKSCVRKSDLGRHVRVHYNDRPFKCNVCGKAFKQDRGRRRHELLHLRNENRKKEDGKISKPFSCDICPKQFNSHRSLACHSNLHKNKYKCGICGQSQSSNSRLNRHMRIHSNEKLFSCNICKKSFSNKYNVKEHMATHSEDRPFQCSVCDKRFKSQRFRSYHELTHLRSNCINEVRSASP